MKMRTIVLTAAMTSMLATGAFAQATRTWVSGVGDDVNPCSRTAPCKTFAGAISKTAAGGEIDALDPGGFGTLTITKGITIDGAGTLASVLHSGTNGLNINAAVTDTVILRNLLINGAGVSPSINGINVINIGAKNLTLENVAIENQGQRCVSVANSSGVIYVSLRNVSMTNCGVTGYASAPSGTGVVYTSLNGVRIQNVGTTSAHHGIAILGGNSNAQLTDVDVFHAAGSGLDVENGALATVDNSVFNRNGADGITVLGVSVSVLRLSSSTTTANGGAGVRASGGNISSYKNNRSSDNGLADSAAATALFY